LAHAPKWIRAKGTAPVTEVAARSLKSRLEPVAYYLRLAALNYEENVEYVHQLRVWTRRADAAIETYRELLPEWRAAWIEKQLRRIRKATNDARDDDVFARRLAADQTPAAASLLLQIREHRIESQRPVVEIHERLTRSKGRFDRRVEKLVKRVRMRGKRRKSKEPTYRAWAEDRLRQILSEFLEMAEEEMQDTHRLHQFRIAGKKLRYAMELLASAFTRNLREHAYPLLEALQNQLGKVNDHMSAVARIRHGLEQSHEPTHAAYLTELLGDEQERLQESLRHYADWWSVEQRKRLREAFSEVTGDNDAARTPEERPPS
jgi:CHAD domain-containing protein